jgi:hypothetical protein
LTPQTQQQKNVDNTPERERERRKTPVLKYNDNNHRNNGRLVGVLFSRSSFFILGRDFSLHLKKKKLFGWDDYTAPVCVCL